jgi:hypothetical protein
MKQGSPDKGRKAYFHHIYFKCKYDWIKNTAFKNTFKELNQKKRRNM